MYLKIEWEVRQNRSSIKQHFGKISLKATKYLESIKNLGLAYSV